MSRLMLVFEGASNSDFTDGKIRWDFLRECAQVRGGNVPIGKLNLRDATHIKPYVLALAVAICEHRRSGDFSVEWPRDTEVRDHLVRLGLADVLRVPAPANIGPRPTNVPLRLLSRLDPRFSFEVGEVLGEELGATLSPGTRARIADSIDEIVLNVLQHSESPIGCVVVGQALPASGVIDVAVADLGITIRGHLSRKYTDLATDGEAIDLAIREGITGTIDLNLRGEPNSGSGLADLLAYMKDSDGELAIVSGGAVAAYGRNDKQHPLLGHRFMGTLVNAKFRVR